MFSHTSIITQYLIIHNQECHLQLHFLTKHLNFTAYFVLIENKQREVWYSEWATLACYDMLDETKEISLLCETQLTLSRWSTPKLEMIGFGCAYMMSFFCHLISASRGPNFCCRFATSSLVGWWCMEGGRQIWQQVCQQNCILSREDMPNFDDAE